LLRRRLTALGAEIASPDEAAGRSGIVSFTLPGQDPAQARRRCLERSVLLSCRAGRLRASPHAYASDDDLDRLIAALAENG
jgi:selenocysteine lyase/cysteine desulfurase